MISEISLIVTTYNWSQALDAVLRSILAQKQLPGEVVIADDGSTDDTARVVEQWQNKNGLTLKHVWQEDEGFQAAKIRNKAAAIAKGKYLVFLDGDCLIREGFIEQHFQLAQAGYFVAGNRVLLSRAFTDEVLRNELTIESWPIKQFQKNQINRPVALRSIPLGPIRKIAPKRWRGVKTCNLGVWRSDLLAVNGFDEAFTGWGYEDSDLVIRLLRNRVRHLSGRYATAVLHLWHSEHDRSEEAENWKRLQQVINSDKRLAVKGVDQYLG